MPIINIRSFFRELFIYLFLNTILLRICYVITINRVTNQIIELANLLLSAYFTISNYIYICNEKYTFFRQALAITVV